MLPNKLIPVSFVLFLIIFLVYDRFVLFFYWGYLWHLSDLLLHKNTFEIIHRHRHSNRRAWNPKAGQEKTIGIGIGGHAIQKRVKGSHPAPHPPNPSLGGVYYAAYHAVCAVYNAVCAVYPYNLSALCLRRLFHRFFDFHATRLFPRGLRRRFPPMFLTFLTRGCSREASGVSFWLFVHFNLM